MMDHRLFAPTSPARGARLARLYRDVLLVPRHQRADDAGTPRDDTPASHKPEAPRSAREPAPLRREGDDAA